MKDPSFATIRLGSPKWPMPWALTAWELLVVRVPCHTEKECGPGGGTVCPKSLRPLLFSACGLQPPFPLSTACASFPKSDLLHSLFLPFPLRMSSPDTESKSSIQAVKPFQKVLSDIEAIKETCRKLGS